MDPNGSTFLVDTQADISLIKQSAIHSHFNIAKHLNTSQITQIRGITNHVIRSIGTISIRFYIHNVALLCTLHVVPDDFNIPSDGILGKDFIKNYNCILDYDHMLLTIKANDTYLEVPILDGPNRESIVLPARCEVLRQFNLTSGHECVILIKKLRLEY